MARSHGDSPESDPVAMGQPPELDAPEQPAVSGNRVSWNQVEGAVGYRVRWRQVNEDWLEQEVPGGTQTTVDLAGLVAGVTYEVKVKALGDGLHESDSDWSDSYVWTVPPPTLTPSPTPTHTATPSPTPGKFAMPGGLAWHALEMKFSWNKVPGAPAASNYQPQLIRGAGKEPSTYRYTPSETTADFDRVTCDKGEDGSCWIRWRGINQWDELSVRACEAVVFVNNGYVCPETYANTRPGEWARLQVSEPQPEESAFKFTCPQDSDKPNVITWTGRYEYRESGTELLICPLMTVYLCSERPEVSGNDAAPLRALGEAILGQIPIASQGLSVIGVFDDVREWLDREGAYEDFRSRVELRSGNDPVRVTNPLLCVDKSRRLPAPVFLNDDDDREFLVSGNEVFVNWQFPLKFYSNRDTSFYVVEVRRGAGLRTENWSNGKPFRHCGVLFTQRFSRYRRVKQPTRYSFRPTTLRMRQGQRCASRFPTLAMENSFLMKANGHPASSG